MKRLLYALVLIPVSALSIFMLVYFLKMDEPLFLIKNVKINGLKQLEYRDLLQKVSPFLKGSLLKVDVPKIREAILAHPFIRDVKIKRVYPFSMVIDVTEKRPSALWIDHEGKISVLDETGEPYRGLSRGDMKLGEMFIINARDADNAKSLYKELERWFAEGLVKKNTISEVLYDEGSMTIFGAEDGVEIILGREEQKERLKRAMIVLEDARRRGLLIKCIDARFEKGAIIQERKG